MAQSIKKYLFSIAFSISLYIVSSLAIATQTLLIVGDSLSASYGIDESKSWMAFLNAKLKQENYDLNIVNTSVSGDTTQQGLDKLTDHIWEHNPQYVILALGSNDGLRGLSIPQMEKNLSEIITTLIANNIKVLLIGFRMPPNYGRSFQRKFERAFNRLHVKNKDAFYVPFMLEGFATKTQEYFLSDGIHPNEKAQPLILKNIWPELKRMLDD